jgi:AraC-like DNA-binding protein
MTSLPSPSMRQVGPADGRLAHLARAITVIRRDHDQTLRVEDLAALAAMSVTSLHRHFRALTSMGMPVVLTKDPTDMGLTWRLGKNCPQEANHFRTARHGSGAGRSRLPVRRSRCQADPGAGGRSSTAERSRPARKSLVPLGTP